MQEVIDRGSNVGIMSAIYCTVALLWTNGLLVARPVAASVTFMHSFIWRFLAPIQDETCIVRLRMFIILIHERRLLHCTRALP